MLNIGTYQKYNVCLLSTSPTYSNLHFFTCFHTSKAKYGRNSLHMPLADLRMSCTILLFNKNFLTFYMHVSMKEQVLGAFNVYIIVGKICLNQIC